MRSHKVLGAIAHRRSERTGVLINCDRQRTHVENPRAVRGIFLAGAVHNLKQHA